MIENIVYLVYYSLPSGRRLPIKNECITMFRPQGPTARPQQELQ